MTDLAAAQDAIRRTNMREEYKQTLLHLPPLYLIAWCRWARLIKGATCTRS